MSVSKSVLTVDDASDYVRLPRNTLSAKSLTKSARGLEAILLAFNDKKVQLSIKTLCLERLELEARKKAMLDRLDRSDSTSAATPEILLKINTKISDNDHNIRRLAGSGAHAVLDALKDPLVQAATNLEFMSEEDAGEGDDARRWRRHLDDGRVTRIDAGYRHTTHDAPTATGGMDLHNKLQRADAGETLSYYQKAQLKYGKGRRGSTSIAG
jgi:hypothetical protein